ncbi:MAG: nickel pincer cofactor biosynthesis protein LarC [Candidatus Eisenbacteria bacterium]
MRIAYVDAFSGVSGDMLLAALVSAGWPAEALATIPGRLRLEGVSVTVSDTRRGPFVAKRVEVAYPPGQPHRHLHHLRTMIEAGDFDTSVKERAIAVFTRLAEAEAEVHGSTVEKVHFHEVGAVDALVDVVGTLEGLRALRVDEVACSPLRLGRGAVRSEHGLIPIPAPATALLVRGVPVEMPDIEAELVTPTGAALVTTLATRWGTAPAFTLERVGIGAGQRDLREQPNVLRLLIGTRVSSLADDEVDPGMRRRRVAVLETALDDENPQLVAALINSLVGDGAIDAMVVPSIMKKGRPGMWLVVLAEPEHAAALAARIMRETRSLGVRVREDERYELVRRIERVETPFGVIEVKVASLPGGGERAVPEFESVRAVAETRGRTIAEVAEAAIAAWARGSG